MDWQPIETAPKDGREILLSFGGYDSGCPLVAAWHQQSKKKGFWVLVGVERQIILTPTHWMPLPEPPKAKD